MRIYDEFLSAGRALRDQHHIVLQADGEILAAHPFSNVPTPFDMYFDGMRAWPRHAHRDALRLLLAKHRHQHCRWQVRITFTCGTQLPFCDLAKVWYGEDRRSPAWRRRTVEEANAIFASLDFPEPFWRWVD